MVYFLALIGMICWGISPLFAKSGLERLRPITGLSLRTFIAASVLFLWTMLTGGMQELRATPPRAVLLILIEALMAMIVGDLAYYAALKDGNASIVMIIMACSPVVTILCSVLFLGERPSLSTLIGACLVVVGLILVV
ncbi:MAG: EamA family transporter [Clostridiales bacterium]|nr:EamA family transporter [Clostridiales bacterium]